MNDDPIGTRLRGLARESFAAAPRPAPLMLLGILAERRRAELASRRLHALTTIACILPMLVIAAACVARPGSPIRLVLIALAAAPGVAAILAGKGRGPSFAVGRGVCRRNPAAV